MEAFEKLPLDELLHLRRAVRALIEQELERRMREASARHRTKYGLN